MSTTVTIKNQIKSVIETYADLVAFPVRKVFEGLRDSIPTTSFPCVCIEPIESKEIETDLNIYVDLQMQYDLYCMIYEEKLDNQLNSIIDFEKKIKKAFSNNSNLSGTGILTTFGESKYSLEYWPIRAVIIPIVVRYRQSYFTRE